MYKNKFLFSIALCTLSILLKADTNAQQLRFEQTVGDITIVLTMDDTQNSTKLKTQMASTPHFIDLLPANPLDTNTINIVASEILQQTCLVPDDNTPIIKTPLNNALEGALQTAIPLDATISTIPELHDPKACISKMLSPEAANTCGCPALPPIEQIVIHVASKESFNLIKNRLIMNLKIIPALYAFFIQESKKYANDDPRIPQLALVIRTLSHNLKK